MLLYGGSGHAKVIRDCIESGGGKVFFIFDDNAALTSLDDTPVIGSYKPDFNIHEELIVSIGDNLVRKVVSEKVRHLFGKAVHSSAIISSYSLVAEGTVVMQGAIINAGTTIGKHVIVNTSAVIEHDCILEDFVHLSPNATLCGNVQVGEGTHIGAGAIVIPNVTIGKWCVIGAGSVVREDIPDYSLVMGIPGKVVRSLAKKV